MQQKAALKTVEEFLGRLQKSMASPGAPRPTRANSDAMVMFSRQGRGVTLLNDEATEYGTVADNLYASLTDARRLTVSRKVIEGLLQEAIVTALFTPPDDQKERLDAAIKLLTRGLSQPTADWEVYLAVSGLAAGKRRRRFGRVVFQPATAGALNALGTRGARIIKRARNSAKDRRAFAVHYRDHIKEVLEGRAIARVIVSAVDQESAVRLARQEVRATLDAISFCDSLLTPHGISLAPAIDGAERAAPPAAVFKDADRQVSFPSEFRGRLVDFQALFQKKGLRAGSKKISDLLAAKKPSAAQQRIKTALGWAGRATGRARPAEAFLFYLIALESLVLGPDKEGELTYRLRVRCAHLLARKPANREFVAKRVSDLYGLRSAIVHKGVRDVSADDLGAARLFAQRAILEVLHTRRIKKGADLEEWFNAQVLR
jgi:hypothetical protein